MQRARVLIIVLLIALAVALGFTALVLQAQRQWRATTIDLTLRLHAGPRAQAPARFDPRELDALPAPVARYLGRVLHDGQWIPRHVRVTWAGEFNLGAPGADRWVPFSAVQDFAPQAPGFVWDARMAMAPGINVHVRDSFVDGRAAMRGQLLGLFTVVDREGAGDFAAAALQRYLGEAIWLPTALLPGPHLQWEAIDDRTARATIRAAGSSATLTFHFGADDLVERVHAAERLYDDGKHPPRRHPWQARVLRHARVDGALVPAEATVEWLLPEGAYAYWRGRPVGISTDPGP
jgi:hypothetical protein